MLNIQYRNGQRPGAVTGMRVDEFNEGIRGMRSSGPSYLTVMVAEHKSKKPAKLAASDQLLEELKDWVLVLCPYMCLKIVCMCS